MNMRRISLSVLILSFAASIFAANTSENAASAIQIKHAVVAPSALQNKTAEVFMELTNKGKQAHTLIAVTTPVAKKAQLHMTINRDARVYMRQVAQINIRPHRETDLEYGGLHVMLIGVKRALNNQEKIPMTLLFRDGSWIKIYAKVKQS